jgi:protein transport protein SEC61 subunit alpha
MRYIDIVRPFMFLLPEVGYPERRLLFREKLLWTLVAMFIFLVGSQIPIYGMSRMVDGDPMYWMRAIFASNKGSLMELGIAPLVTSSMGLQLLTGAKILSYDSRSREDKDLYHASQKFSALLLTVFQAAGYVLSGSYGPVAELGPSTCMLIVAQLFFGGVVVILLDEMLAKGHGIGNATNLFILSHVSQRIMAAAVSPLSITTSRGSEYEGALLSFLHTLFTNPRNVLYAFFRTDGANLTSLLTTTVIAVLALYIQGYRIDIPVKYQKVRSMETTYPIKLFYTGSTPAVLLGALVGNMYFVSQVLYSNLPSNFLVNLIGQWQSISADPRAAIPVGGLAYWISPPGSILEFFRHPFHVVFYSVFVLAACTFFARYWIEVTHSGSREVAKNLKEHNLTMKGYRDTTVVAVLDRYIPTTAALGGFALGALLVMADLLGCIGSGAGLILATTTVYTYFELIIRETSQGGL